MKKTNLGFTFIELIIVIIILGILATIGFASYTGYIGTSRDANRVSQIKEIYKSLQLYATNKYLPLPDDAINISATGAVIGYQGYVGENILNLIEYSNGGTDPKDNNYFTFVVAKNKKDMQILTFLEGKDNLEKEVASSLFIPQTYAALDYSNRYPKTTGKKLGVLLQPTTQIPAQSIPAVKTAGYIDIVTTSDIYTSVFSDNDSITGDGTSLAIMQPNASCRRIFELGKGKESGIYTINPTGEEAFDVYCDMETDGGGWTAATMLADTTTANLFYTTNTQKITSLTDNISTKGVITSLWSDNGDKDIMIQCFLSATGEIEKYKTPFFIYDFPKTDIGNLTKDAKQGTLLSNKFLSAKWNSVEYALQNNWGASGNSNSHFFVSNNGIVFGLASGASIWQWSSISAANQNSPAHATSDGGQSISASNYCVTLLR